MTRYGLTHASIQSVRKAATADYLDRANTTINSAIARARRQVEFVQEYRTRLIADVVTGKLDVRAAAAQLPDDAAEAEPIEESGPMANGLPGDLYEIDETVGDSVLKQEVTP